MNTLVPPSAALWKMVERFRRLRMNRVTVPVPAHIIKVAKQYSLDAATVRRMRQRYFDNTAPEHIEQRLEQRIGNMVPFNRVPPPF
jgi:hypothetical protein